MAKFNPVQSLLLANTLPPPFNAITWKSNSKTHCESPRLRLREKIGRTSARKSQRQFKIRNEAIKRPGFLRDITRYAIRIAYDNPSAAERFITAADETCDFLCKIR